MECLECAITVPQYPAKCDRIVLPGGVKGFVLAKCGASLTDMTDLDEWCTKKLAGLLASTSMRRIMGSVPEPEEAVAKLGSCDPDELLSLRHTLDIIDYNSEDPTVGYSQDQFYNWLNLNYQKLQVGFLTCDDRFYGWVKSFTVTCKRVTEGNNFDGKTFWHLVFKWDQKNHLQPLLIPGLGDKLENCSPAAVNYAFQVDGTTYGKVTAVPYYSDNFCEAFWFKLDPSSTNPGALKVYNTYFKIYALPFVDEYRIAVNTNDGGAPYIWGLFGNGASNFVADEWHHIAVLKSSAGGGNSRVKVFIDGILVSNTTHAQGEVASLGLDYQIGEPVANSKAAFDDVVYYTNGAVLTDADVIGMYSGIYPPGYEFLYDFDEGATDPVQPLNPGGKTMDIVNPPVDLNDCFITR